MAASVFPRVILIVLDSVGIGELPDAQAYGDQGSDTLGNIARAVSAANPDAAIAGPRTAGSGTFPDKAGRASTARQPDSAYGRMAEASPGKDSVTGHWEMMGIVLDRPFPTFPDGFPPELIAEFERRIGRRTLGNVVASGTEIIVRLGAEHMATGWPIVYTSADSVFQIAAHEDVIPIAEQYRICEIAFDLVARGMGVGRVIARPFIGAPGRFARTARRHDYALEPSGRHAPRSAQSDRYAGNGDREDQGSLRRPRHRYAVPTASDDEGIVRIAEVMADTGRGLIFANLVDFDSVYGHRNDMQGYAANLERFDAGLATLLPRLRPTDLLVITADHGNDPTTPSTDHSREYVPLLLTGSRVRKGVDIGTRSSFADLGQTLATNFAVGPLAHGASFLEEIVVHHS